MAKNDQEVEAKFAIRDLAKIEQRLKELGAELASPRVLETNLRFDTPDLALSRARQVLRLRQDAGSVMTFKGPAKIGEAVSVRQEIEFQVSDFAAARRLLEALGYVVAVIYEKYRTTYHLDDLSITLDEMPFGSFMEIEGPGADSIQKAAADLHLDWDARSSASYLGLFDLLRNSRGLSARNLTFEELQGVQASPEEYGMRYSDQSL
jgi:adenylate cyclase, class 2